MQADELTGAAVFLASEDADSVTGATLYVDRGLVGLLGGLGQHPLGVRLMGMAPSRRGAAVAGVAERGVGTRLQQGGDHAGLAVARREMQRRGVLPVVGAPERGAPHGSTPRSRRRRSAAVRPSAAAHASGVPR